jgi:hypothetical protein
MESDIIRSIGRVEAKVDMMIDRFDKLDDRAHSIEKKQWYHTGALAVAAAFLLPKIRAFAGI